MNMEDRSACRTYVPETDSPEPPKDVGGAMLAIRHEIRERAQRLHLIGELRAAAELFAQLASSR